MSQVDELVRQAMALSDEDRAYVVTILERSLIGRGSATTDEPDLPSDAVTGEAFLAELERRSAAYRAGTMTARPAAEVLAELRARQASEKSA